MTTSWVSTKAPTSPVAPGAAQPPLRGEGRDKPRSQPSGLIRPSVDRDRAAEKALRAWAFKDAEEEDRAVEDYERLSYGCSGASASVLVTPLELEARRYSCRSEDLSTYDVDGVVRG